MTCTSCESLDWSTCRHSSHVCGRRVDETNMGEIEWLNEWTLYTACTFHNSLGQFSCRNKPHVSVVEE